MGITSNDFFEYLYSVIFSPKAFFEKKDIQISIRLAIALIISIAAINSLSAGIINRTIYHWTFILSFIWQIIISIFWWFMSALFFEYIAKIFDRNGNLNKLLFLSAFVPVPYIFFTPLNLLKNMFEIGYMIASISEMFIFIWIIWLYALVLKSVYNITNARAIMMIFIPFISTILATYWAVYFINKIWYIFTI